MSFKHYHVDRPGIFRTHYETADTVYDELVGKDEVVIFVDDRGTEFRVELMERGIQIMVQDHAMRTQTVVQPVCGNVLNVTTVPRETL